MNLQKYSFFCENLCIYTEIITCIYNSSTDIHSYILLSGRSLSFTFYLLSSCWCQINSKRYDWGGKSDSCHICHSNIMKLDLSTFHLKYIDNNWYWSLSLETVNKYFRNSIFNHKSFEWSKNFQVRIEWILWNRIQHTLREKRRNNDWKSYTVCR